MVPAVLLAFTASRRLLGQVQSADKAELLALKLPQGRRFPSVVLPLQQFLTSLDYPWNGGGSSMGKFFNHYKSDRAVGFAHPYNERNPEPWHCTLGYRGYDLDVERHVSLWLVGIHPRRPELPILRRCQVQSHNQEEAVLEAKRRVDARLLA